MERQTETLIETLFTASKNLPINSQKIFFERYHLTSIPTKKDTLDDTNENMLLSFVDKWEKNQMASNPIFEVKYVIAMLSLIFRMNVNYVATKIDFIHEIRTYKKINYFNGNIKIPNEIDSIFKMINSIDINVARQIIRSCQMYQTAISIFDKDFSLSYFLLVTAVECLSNITYKKMSNREKFKKFILDYLPDEIKQEELKDQELLMELMDEAYNIRSGFTHGGKPLPPVAYTLNIKSKYVKHYVNKKEVKTPRITWFENIVNGVIFEYIKKQILGSNKNNLSKLALEESTVHLKVKRSIKAGTLLTENDVDIR